MLPPGVCELFNQKDNYDTWKQYLYISDIVVQQCGGLGQEAYKKLFLIW